MSIVTEWLEVSAMLSSIKAKELELRNKVAPLVLAGKVEGSKTSTIEGVKLTAQAVMNYTLGDVSSIYDSLTEEELSCLEWKLVLKVPAYKKLDPAVKYTLRSVVTVKPGQAQLSYKGEA